MNRQHLLNCIDKTMLDNLYGFCYRRTSDHYEADELCSDILLAVAAASARGGEISDPTAFLWKIAHTVYADFSEPFRAYYEKFLRNKYKTVENLRHAWNKPEATFENPIIPDLDARSHIFKNERNLKQKFMKY